MTLKYRKDYVAPHYALPKTDLDFTLDLEKTIVKAKLTFTKVDISKPIVLNGQHMELLSVKIDGEKLADSDYILDDETLMLVNTKSSFVLETEVQINPTANTQLMGLYVSNGLFCTQCEPQGFRNITYYPDHSDVPSKFTVSIRANRKKYPVLLSNGNKIIDDGDVVVWEDPFNKPCYLFALVAGDLDCISDTFKTMSGKVVDLRLYCEKGKGDRLRFAMDSLKLAMAWDEKNYGLEYDLNLFNIVAVAHFNAGAMENKSLNIFNDAVLLASPETATDANYENIEETIAHEYFHNYSGDRVTLRDWFELSLKEGFTVFRHESFKYDVRSRAVGRIDDVMMLRTYQFPEDDGPLSHQVRPDSYHEIENFYTGTIYDKGAEVIRMQQALVGADSFRKGCDLYFTRHDGQAVTIDDFVAAIADASGKDLTHFKRWYSTAGRPKVKVETKYDAKSKEYTVKLKQSHKFSTDPFVIPLPYGLVGKEGRDLHKGVMVLDAAEKEFTFELTEHPVLSINRFFTCPIDLEIQYSDEDRVRLMTHDSDLFNRYEIGHQYALERLVHMVKTHAKKPDETVIAALGSYLIQDLDKAFVARAIAFPSEDEIAEKMDVIDVVQIKRVRKMMRETFAQTYKDTLLKLYHENESKGAFSADSKSAARRAIKNMALGYLALTEHKELVMEQFKNANNLTDRMAAFGVLISNKMPEADEAVQTFYHLYENENLVLNKWFAVQMMADGKQALKNAEELIKHPKFDYKNPNKVRALIGAFSGNLEAFNAPDGSGYKWFAGQCLIIDKMNPSLAARLLTRFSKCKKFGKETAEHATQILAKLIQDKSLSSVARETVERMK